MHINASCGGEGVCGKCRIILEEGKLECPDSTILTRDEWSLGYRQACQCSVLSDIVVRIPPESLLDKKTITRRRAGISLRPSPIDVAALKEEGLYNPAFQKKFLKLPICNKTYCNNDYKEYYGDYINQARILSALFSIPPYILFLASHTGLIQG